MSEEEAAAADLPLLRRSRRSSSAPITPKGAVGRITLRRERMITNPGIVEERLAAHSDSGSSRFAAAGSGADRGRRDAGADRRAAKGNRLARHRQAKLLRERPRSCRNQLDRRREDSVLHAREDVAPGLAPSELADVKEQCARVFARLSEAHKTLTDPAQRKRYMKLMKEGGETPEQQQEIANVVTAAVEFQKAEICLKKNDIVHAEESARHAVRWIRTRPITSRSSCGLKRCDPMHKSPEATQTKIDMLLSRHFASTRNASARIYRAMLYKRQGRTGLALEDFKMVADLNPKNIDAQRELRISEMRGNVPRSPAPGKSGIIHRADGERRAPRKVVQEVISALEGIGRGPSSRPRGEARPPLGRDGSTWRTTPSPKRSCFTFAPRRRPRDSSPEPSSSEK